MSGRDPASLGCCARYAHQVTGKPVLLNMLVKPGPQEGPGDAGSGRAG